MNNKKNEKEGHRLEVKNTLMGVGWLENLYFKKGLTAKAIAKIVGCSSSAVGRAMKRLNIKTNKPRSKYPILNDKKWLKDVYLNKKFSTSKIAEIAGCDDGLVYDMLKNTLKLPMRKLGEAQKIRGLRDRRENSSNWKGGRVKRNGYIFIYNPEYESSMKNGYIAEHRMIAEKNIGRKLKKGEVVHHVNGKKSDNSSENLIVLNRDEHKLTHIEVFKELTRLKSLLIKHGISY